MAYTNPTYPSYTNPTLPVPAVPAVPAGPAIPTLNNKKEESGLFSWLTGQTTKKSETDASSNNVTLFSALSEIKPNDTIETVIDLKFKQGQEINKLSLELDTKSRIFLNTCTKLKEMLVKVQQGLTNSNPSLTQNPRTDLTGRESYRDSRDYRDYRDYRDPSYVSRLDPSYVSRLDYVSRDPNYIRDPRDRENRSTLLGGKTKKRKSTQRRRRAYSRRSL